MILLLLFAFLSGMGTILAPCIWPVLPIVLSSSIAGGDHRRPLGITLGVMISFAFFTLTVSTIVRLFHVDANILRLFAVIVITFLGLMMVIPRLGIWIDVLISRLSGKFGGKTAQGGGFMPGFITGLALGVVWAPCAGPILATIATLAATGQVNVDVVLVTIAYVLGVGIPLFAFAYGGQRFLARAKKISPFTGAIQKGFGVMMILTALAIFTNLDIKFQAAVLERFPAIGTALYGFEKSDVVTKQLDKLRGTKQQIIIDENALLNSNAMAPDFVGITKWLNTPSTSSGQAESLKISQLRGKVVLVDFWTYTCINCIRTLPHVTSWYEKYKDQGFVVIGVHTPEFEFEKDTDNVLKAMKDYKINYPVAQDNDYGTWNNYSNRYWPAHYLIDKNGIIRRTHFGEGEYAETEKAIQMLLKEAGKKVDESFIDMPDKTPVTRNSPETYLGSNRMEYYFPTGYLPASSTKKYTLAKDINLNSFSLGGEWAISHEYSTSGEKAVLEHNYYGDKVFLVMRTTSAKAKVKVYLDGKLVDNLNAGADVIGGIVMITNDRLYTLIDSKGNPGNHLLRLEFDRGIEVFAFTFG